MWAVPEAVRATDSRAGLPSGTVTMLFTDIEGSTQRVLALGTDRWESVLEAHAGIIRESLAAHHGVEVRTEGDAFFAVFPKPTEAVAAVAAAQRAIASATWPHGAAVQVRMGLHTGEVRPASTAAGADYVGFEIHRAARIAAVGYGGQVLVSDTTETLVRDALPPGLGLRDLGEHRFKDLLRPQRLFQLLIDGLPSSFPPLRTLDATPNNLPTQAASFVGRAREIASAVALLMSSRLVTLTGPGGSGKTRLALHVVADTLDRYPDGVWLAELAIVTDPSTVAARVAAAMRLPVPSGVATVASVAAALGQRELLLVIDNCEHLIGACAELAAALLRSCPRVKILATSREGLGVPGEALMPVPPLRLPEGDTLPPLDELADYEAIRLFVDRSVAHLPTFALTAENAADVVRICRRLDGIPLALELAAARVPALALDQLAQRLDDRFRLLTGGGRTVVARQQTLRALIDWSYDLLDEPDRLLLRRVAVFVDGWTLDAAETVCAGDGLEREAVLDHLAHLVDKSLVTLLQRSGLPRYTMLETVRDYAREKLLDSGDVLAVRQRHFDYFFEFVQRSVTLHGSVGVLPAALEYENLRAAIDWIEADPAGLERELLFLGSMGPIAATRGRGAELRRFLTGALARSDASAKTPGRARALLTASQLAGTRGDYAIAAALGEEAIGLLRALGAKRELAYALIGLARALMPQPAAVAAASEARALLEELGDTWGLAFSFFIVADGALEHGDYAAARHGLAESLTLFRQLGDLQLSASPLLSLARLSCIDGDYAAARGLVEEALSIRRQQVPDSRLGVAIALISLGEVDRCAGDPDAAASSFEPAVESAREVGDGLIVSWAVHNLGHVALQAGDLWAAAARFKESLAFRRQSGPSVNVAASVAGFAAVAMRAAAVIDAAWLYAAADAMLTSVNGVLPPPDEQVRQADLAAIGSQPDADAIAAARADARAADLERIERACNAVATRLIARHA